MSEREALYGTKHKTEKIRPPSFKNLVDFLSLSLSLSFDGDDSDKLLLIKLGGEVSFTSFDLLFASSYFVVVVVVVVCVCVCVFSFSLEDGARQGRRKSGCLVCRKRRKKREKREKERETRFNWPESPLH